ncbi:transcriptional regulator [Savitreella phatthalungensis]
MSKPPMLAGPMTKEKLQDIYRRYKQLAGQGERDETNVEMQQLGAILRRVQERQRHAHEARQQQQISTLAATSAAGANGVSTSTTHIAATNPVATAVAMPAQSGDPSVPPAALSTAQLELLKNQIMAFKYLSKNLPIPDHIQRKISGEIGKDIRPRAEDFAGAVSESELLHGADVMIPAITPSGVEIADLAERREQVIANRVAFRVHELESLPSNIDGFEFGRVRDELGDAKLRLLIELKSLKLLHRQKHLREQMLHSLSTFLSTAATHDRQKYRRVKAQSLKESRMTEQFARTQRLDRERREKQKQLDYLADVTSHSVTVRQESEAARAKSMRLGKQILAYHTYAEKEEQRRVERNTKLRLQALKADDEESYLKLIDQAKDTRITHLLKQTNSYLDSLAEAVKQQQGEGEALVESKIDDAESGPAGEKSEEAQDLDYFHIAHRIQEEIIEQPRILVGGQLKEYQLKGLQWMVSLYNNKLNGILADEMGLGKTIQTISLITFLIEKKKQDGPYLVIVPLSTLTNWTLEFEKWAPSVSKIVYKGTPGVRRQLANQVRSGNFQVLLTTFEYIIKDRPILSKLKWVHMIIDEGHRMKNANSKLSSTLVQYYSTRYRLILTGTPLQNNLPELWALLNFVLPKIFNSVKSFDEWFNTPFANTGGQDKMELSEEESLLVIRRLHKVLRPFLLRRLKKDVEKDLPDKVENVIKCPLSALQKKLYDQMKKHGMLFVGGGEDSKAGKSQGIRGLNNTLMQLRKICNHPFVFEEVERSLVPTGGNDDFLWRTSGKFELLDRVLPKFQRTGHRVLMFFQMTQIMNIMEDFLHYRGMTYLRLDGSTKADDRSALLKLYNAPDSDYFIFLLSTRAGGLGLNLQTADTVIIFDSDWNPHQDLQAQDRAHRIGQTQEVRILRLITEKSIEESILARAQYKLDIDGKVIQAGKFDNKSTAEEREAFLRSLLESDPATGDDDGANADGSENGDDEDDEFDIINEIIARNDDEVELFREMDRVRDAISPYGKDKDFPRLMSEKELPAAYLKDDHAVQQDYFADIGTGKRERKEAVYDDGLTEEQWLAAVDEGEDPREAASKRRAARQARMQAAVDPGESGATSPAPSSIDTPGHKKRGLHSRQLSVDPESIPRKRAKTSIASAASVASPEIQRRLDARLNVALEFIATQTSDEGEHALCDIFNSLPSRRDYPDYYKLIKTPISLGQIRRRVKKSEYATMRSFKADMELMYANARTYNEAGSFVVKDADKIERLVNEKLASSGSELDENGEEDEE